MSATVHLLEQLQKTDLLIERLHQEIAEKPNSLSLQATLTSLEKRHRKLEKDLIFEMESQHIENSTEVSPSKEKITILVRWKSARAVFWRVSSRASATHGSCASYDE